MSHSHDFNTAVTQCSEASLLHALFVGVGDEVVFADTSGHIRYCGEGVARMLGYCSAEMLNISWQAFIAGDNPCCCSEKCQNLPETAMPTRLLHKSGSAVPVTGKSIPIADQPGVMIGHLYLVRETPHHTHGFPFNDLQEQVLEESNHRVRNNLAMICALLDMEMLQAPENERHRLLVSLARTRGLALVHNLVQGSSQQVELGMLARAVIDSSRALFERIEGVITVTCASPIHITSKRATYLSLVLTELAVHLISCSNERGNPTFPVIAVEKNGSSTVITVTGSSCTPDHQKCRLTALSREIITGLVERSLDGKIMLSHEPPFGAVITFPIA